MKHASVIPGLLLLSVGLALATSTPPDALNYQGVLRDYSDQPLDGTYGMIFRFFDAESGGDEILVDTHGTVNVSGGLFSVQLGSGSVTDGSGPGDYTTVSRVMATYPDLYLEVQVAAETLSPRIRVVSSGYSLNTRYVRGVEIVSDGPLDLYVDAITGDDGNDGMSALTAKRTIQAALDAIGLVIAGPVTVRVADGTYPESLLIWEHVRRGEHPIRLEGNPTSPQDVFLDGQNVLERGILVGDPAVEIVGFRISNYDEQAISFFNTGGGIVERCEITGNTSQLWEGAVDVEDGSWCDMVESLVSNNGGSGFNVQDAAHLELVNTTITSNAGHGVQLARGSQLFLDGATITANGASGVWTMLSEVNAYVGSGNVQITGNQWGVYAAGSSMVDFHGHTGIVVQSNVQADMVSESHSTIRGYGNGTVGGCVTGDTHSMCNP